jgi:hypothetical protein
MNTFLWQYYCYGFPKKSFESNKVISLFRGRLDECLSKFNKNCILASNYVFGEKIFRNRDISLFVSIDFWETVKILMLQVSVHNWCVQNPVVNLPKEI